MKYIEKIPARYDKMMNILTLGGHRRSRLTILSAVKPGARVLDIGCGSGSFAAECAAKGALVTAVDSSPQMLSILKNRLRGSELENRVKIIECGSASTSAVLNGEKFDMVVMSMMLGELSPIVRAKTIKCAAELLGAGGTIIICDELWPENFILSAIYHFLFWIFFIPNFILTRTLITPVKGLGRDLAAAGLEIRSRKSLFMGVISILYIGETGRTTSPAASKTKDSEAWAR
jgi:ubiquinone/menaquinone biosynthesis C-methylase UbiE